MAARAMAKGKPAAIVRDPPPAAIVRDPLAVLPDDVADIMPPLKLSPIQWRWPRYD